MDKEEKYLLKRFEELAARAKARGCFCYTDFLNLSLQSELLSRSYDVPVTLFGGFEGAERQVARFGEEPFDFGREKFPIDCVAAKFSDIGAEAPPGHRDFLGALLSCGLSRDKIGDIVLCKGCAYIFCFREISPFISENLTRVRHVSVVCTPGAEPPDEAIPQPEEKTVVAASLRLDALVSAVYNLSRGESGALFMQKKVFVNGRAADSGVKAPGEGDIISVRGYGRFIFASVNGQTRSGKLRVCVKVY